MAVDRCICHNITFARLKEHSQRCGLEFHALSILTGCSTNCGMCKPYILQMIATGQTAFPPLSVAAAAGICAEHDAAVALRSQGENAASPPVE